MKSFIESLKDHVYLVGDIGSTHGGSLKVAMETIKMAHESGLDAVKFQLGVCSPNIDFSLSHYILICDYGKKLGIDISTSIFSNDNPDMRERLISTVIESKPKWIKFSYSQKHLIEDQKRFYDAGIAVVVSCDTMTRHIPIDEAIKIYCIPEYPVRYQVSCEGIFERFYGTSDHTLGVNQTVQSVRREVNNLTSNRVIIPSCKWIEKHICLNKDDASCPDSFFAIDPIEIKTMVNAIRTFEGFRKKVKGEYEQIK
jgi:sialic acid synthase SpsE